MIGQGRRRIIRKNIKKKEEVLEYTLEYFTKKYENELKIEIVENKLKD